MFSALDTQMMQTALELAKLGRFSTSPNPRVGCVIAHGAQIVGQGFHVKAGEPHAEVHALRQAGAAAKGATAYVTLEPCSHYGRTPPCAEALVHSGVTRVVAAMTDPNPLVSGKGLSMLEAAGIRTESGLLEAQARELNRGSCRVSNAADRLSASNVPPVWTVKPPFQTAAAFGLLAKQHAKTYKFFVPKVAPF